MGDRPLRFGLSGREPGGPRARDVKAWVRAAARAPEDATIVVTELACSEPGCAEVTRLWQEGEGEGERDSQQHHTEE